MPIHVSDKETEYFIRMIKLVNTFCQIHACVGVTILIVIIWINNEHALQGGIKNTSSSVMHTRVIFQNVECACTQESYTVEAINPPKGLAKRGLYTQEVVMHR